MSKYLTCAETAKLVRQALKEAFPGIKFSVRSDVYAGGASIHVKWVDGPTEKQVDQVAETFAGSYFDGMTDFKGTLQNLYQGEMVRFGADFVFCNRDYSARLIENAIAAIWAKRYAGLADVPRPTAEDFKAGRCNNVKWGQITAPGFDLRDVIFQELARRTDRFAKPSATAACVTFLGNDGYSQVGALAVPA